MRMEDRLRGDIDRLIHAALNAVSPDACMRRAVGLDGDLLIVNGEPIDLAKIRRIIVVGAGKASAGMARSLEGILGERIDVGLVVTAGGYRAATTKVEMAEASHPVPDGRGLAAAERLARLVDGATEDDLVIVLISGGGSALLPLPVDGIALADLSRTNELLLRSGATIQQVNAVRKHLSQLKGGRLAARAFPARVISLILSDVVGAPLDAIASGPTVADPTTYADASRILHEYGLWSALPSRVRSHVERGVRGEVPETPKPGDDPFSRVQTMVIGSGSDAAEATLNEAETLGYHSLLLTTTLQGEAREVGKVLASIACEELKHERPLPLPALIVASGETTVTVTGAGKGGRNQELALSAALGIEGVPGAVIASVGTDGRDGPTDAAGGIVDGETISRLREHGIDAPLRLAENDSYHALASSGDLIMTGPTGTNVADLCLILVGKQD
ncbi:MAG TPA: glycerate kinase [Candidatus Acetothermia bacterium]|nr:glycerate kinase [Candidatus Acetothermia bacterium]